MYPNYYVRNNQMYPTMTADFSLTGDWLMVSNNRPNCNVSSEACYFSPNISLNKDLVCSIGSLPFLSNVHRYCMPQESLVGSRNVMLPTKQNVLCDGKGALEVIKAHQDWILMDSSTDNIRNNIPPLTKISFVHAAQTPIILAVETSTDMVTGDRWKWLSKALRKLILYDLSSEERVALLTFSNTSAVQHGMEQLNLDSVRRRMADSIPSKHKVRSNPRKSCVLCAVETAIRLARRIHEVQGAHLVLAIQGDESSLSHEEELQVVDYVQKFGLQLSVIMLPQAKQVVLPTFDEIAKKSGGKSYLLPSRQVIEGTKYYADLLDIFKQIQSHIAANTENLSVVIHKQMASHRNFITQGSFVVDKSLGRETTFGVLVNDADNHFVRAVHFFDSYGQVYGPFSKFSNDFNQVNLKAINFVQTESVPPFDDVSKSS